jgi:hypothetical protein
MKERVPRSITIGEFQRRSRLVRRIARRMGFIGRVSYRHVYNDSGGGQYELGPLPEQDQLIVSAEAFERDADLSEYSLEAIIAHERGHQIYSRDPRVHAIFAPKATPVLEEFAASIIGSILVESTRDQRDLMYKACFEACNVGVPFAEAWQLCRECRQFLEEMLCLGPNR